MGYCNLSVINYATIVPNYLKQEHYL